MWGFFYCLTWWKFETFVLRELHKLTWSSPTRCLDTGCALSFSVSALPLQPTMSALCRSAAFLNAAALEFSWCCWETAVWTTNSRLWMSPWQWHSEHCVPLLSVGFCLNPVMNLNASCSPHCEQGGALKQQANSCVPWSHNHLKSMKAQKFLRNSFGCDWSVVINH